MEYRIVTVRSADSGEPVGYFDRWHALVFLGDQRLGYGQSFTRRRAERRAKKAAKRHQRASQQRELRPVRETSYRLPGADEAEALPRSAETAPAEQAISADDIEDMQGKRLGEILVGRGLVSSPDLTSALMEQLGTEVAKEGGLYSGLCQAIGRRHPRAGDATATDTVRAQTSGSNPPAISHIRGGEPASDQRPLGQLAEQGAAASNIAELEQELEELKLELSAARPALADERDRHATTERELEQARREGERLWTELSGREARIAELVAGLAERDRRIAELQSLLEQAHGQRDASAASLAAAQARAEQATGELAEARAAIAELEQRLSEQANRAGELEAALEQLRRKREAQGTTLVELRARAEDRERLAAELAERDRRISELDTLVEALHDQRQASETKLGQVQAGAEQATGELAEARAAIAELEARTTTFSDQLSAAVAARAAESESQAETRERLDQALAELDTERRKLQETAARLEPAQAELAAVQAREAELAAKIEERLEDAALRLLAARSEHEAASARLAEAESRLAEEAAAHAETRRVLAQALGELTGFRPQAAAGDRVPDLCLSGEYIYFLAGISGYELVSGEGPLPAAGDAIELRQERYVVTKVGRSPLPFDRRRCVYLQASS